MSYTDFINKVNARNTTSDAEDDGAKGTNNGYKPFADNGYKRFLEISQTGGLSNSAGYEEYTAQRRAQQQEYTAQKRAQKQEDVVSLYRNGLNTSMVKAPANAIASAPVQAAHDKIRSTQKRMDEINELLRKYPITYDGSTADYDKSIAEYEELSAEYKKLEDEHNLAVLQSKYEALPDQTRAEITFGDNRSTALRELTNAGYDRKTASNIYDYGRWISAAQDTESDASSTEKRQTGAQTAFAKTGAEARAQAEAAQKRMEEIDSILPTLSITYDGSGSDYDRDIERYEELSREYERLYTDHYFDIQQNRLEKLDSSLRERVLSGGSRGDTVRALEATGLSRKEAQDLYDFGKRLRQDEAAQDYEETIAQASGEGALTLGERVLRGAGASAGSVVPSMLSGVGTVDALIQQTIHPTRPVNYSTALQNFASTDEIIRETVSNNIAKDTGSELLVAGYNLSMSMLDSVTANLIGRGIGQLAGTMGAGADTARAVASVVNNSIFAGSASQSYIRDAKERGATDSQALAGGILAGAAEAIFEELSFGAFYEGMDAVGKPTVKQAVKHWLTESGINGLEELNTEVADIFSDWLIMGDISDVAKMRQDYIDSGKTEKQAKRLTTYAMAARALEAGIGGFLQGFIMTGIEIGKQYSNTRQLGKQLQQSGQVERLSEVTGKELSGASALTVGDTFAKAYETYTSDLVTEEKIRQYLTSSGVKNGNNELVGIVRKGLDGQQLSDAEYKTLTNDKAAAEAYRAVTQDGVTQDGDKLRAQADSAKKLLELVKLSGDEALIRQAAVEIDRADAAGVDQSEAAYEALKTTSAYKSVKGIQQKAGTGYDAAARMNAEEEAQIKAAQLQSQDSAQYDDAASALFAMGYSGTPEAQAMETDSARYLTTAQREIAYFSGVSKRMGEVSAARANGQSTARNSGRLFADKAAISALRENYGKEAGDFSGIIRLFANVTGRNIQLTASTADSNGEYHLSDANGVDYQGKNTADNIVIDVNAGLANITDRSDVAKYTALRTLGHEIVHDMATWAAGEYDTFKRFCFEVMGRSGKNVDRLIAAYAEEYGVSYEKASDEVLAESLADILPQTKFIEELTEKHRNIAQKVRDAVKSFADRVRKRFDAMAKNEYEGKAGLVEEANGTIRYLDEIVKEYDAVMVQAYENLRKQSGKAENKKAAAKKQQEAGENAAEKQRETDSEGGNYQRRPGAGTNAALDEEYLELAKDPVKNRERLQEMVDEKANEYLNDMLLPNDSDEVGFKFHRGATPTKTFKRYAVFNVSKDGFRAAYAGNKNPTPVGVWLDAQNLKSYTSDKIQFKDGSFATYIPGDTGKGWKDAFSADLWAAMRESDNIKASSGWLLERGGKHSSDVPNFSQMNLKHDENGNPVKNAKRDGVLPHNKLIFEIEYGTSDDGNITDYVREHGRIDATGKNQGLAKIKPNQFYDFKTNPNATGNWGIGGTFRIVRLVPHDEVVSKTLAFKTAEKSKAVADFESGKISSSDMKKRIAGADAVAVQKWDGGYHPEDFGLSVESVNELYKQGQRKKLTDPVTYDDNGNVIPLSERFNAQSDDIRYQLRGGGAMSDTSVLDAALGIQNQNDFAKWTENERFNMNIYSQQLEAVRSAEEERHKLSQKWNALTEAGKGADEATRKAIARAKRELQIEMAKQDEEIRELRSKLEQIQRNDYVQNVLQKTRAALRQYTEETTNQLAARYYDKGRNSERIKRERALLDKNVSALLDWIDRPDPKKGKSIPEAIQNPIRRVLHALQFEKSANAFARQIRDAKMAIEAQTEVDTGGMVKINGALVPVEKNLYSSMEQISANIEKFEQLYGTDSGRGAPVVNRLTYSELREINDIVEQIKHLVTDYNKILYNNNFATVDEMAKSFVSYIGNASSNKPVGGITKYLEWSNIRPTDLLARFGEAGKALDKGFRNGQATYAFNIDKIVSYVDSIFPDGDIRKVRKALSEQTVTIHQGENTAELPMTYLMGLYCYYQQADSRRHLLKNGVIFNGIRGDRIAGDFQWTPTEAELTTLFARADFAQARDIAVKLQSFMATYGAQLINEVYMKLYGIRIPPNPTYYPISTNDTTRAKRMDQEQAEKASLFRLLNMSFTKPRNQKAINQLACGGIFDVFKDHMFSVAQYNAFALPVLDAIRFLNWAETEYDYVDEYDRKGTARIGANVQEALEKAFGREKASDSSKQGQPVAVKYLTELIKAYNGDAVKGSELDSKVLQFMQRKNAAQVMYNLGTALNQPLSIVRAGAVIENRYIVAGAGDAAAHPMQMHREMLEHSGIALWKDMGFFSNDISQSVDSLIGGSKTLMDRIYDIGSFGMETADSATWTVLWAAAKRKAIAQGAKPGTQGYWDTVTGIFEDIIYQTQVVDTVLTKASIMRQKGFITKEVTAFMAEPIASWSNLVSAFDEYKILRRQGVKASDAYKRTKDKIWRTIVVHLINYIITVAYNSLRDTIRDDDDYETVWQKFLEAAQRNLIEDTPVFFIPGASTIFDFAEYLGNEIGFFDTGRTAPKTLAVSTIEPLIKAISDGIKMYQAKKQGKEYTGTTKAGIAYKLLQFASSMSGVPVSSLSRSIMDTGGIINLFRGEGNRLQITYDSGTEKELQYSFEDGFVTEQDAIYYLTRDGGMSKDEAWITVQKWMIDKDDGAFYELDSAAIAGNAVQYRTAYNELSAHGMKETEIKSRTRSTLKDAYLEGAMTATNAAHRLEALTGMEPEEAVSRVQYWDWKSNNPDSELSEAALNKWRDNLKPLGVTAEQWEEWWSELNAIEPDTNARNETIVGSGKDKKLAYIRRLNVSHGIKVALEKCI